MSTQTLKSPKTLYKSFALKGGMKITDSNAWTLDGYKLVSIEGRKGTGIEINIFDLEFERIDEEISSNRSE